MAAGSVLSPVTSLGDRSLSLLSGPSSTEDPDDEVKSNSSTSTINSIGHLRGTSYNETLNSAHSHPLDSPLTSPTRTAHRLRSKSARELPRHSSNPTPQRPQTLWTSISSIGLNKYFAQRSETPIVSNGSRTPALASLQNLLQDSASTNVDSRRSLFDEVSFNSAPGNIHLLSDEAIDRFVCRYGATNVVRQLARDLAQRESEVILARQQYEDKERELRKLLGQCGVSMAEVDKRLHNMKCASLRRPKQVLDELIQEAINEEPMMTTTINDNDNDLNERKTSMPTLEQRPVLSRAPMKRRSWSTLWIAKADKKICPESVISEDDAESMYSTETNHTFSHQEDAIDRHSVFSNNSTNYNSIHRLSPDRRTRSASQVFHPTEWIPRTIKNHVPQVQNAVSPVRTRNRVPMELENIVPQSSQPPTLLPSWNDHYGLSGEFVTDRFGFIHDRHKDEPILEAPAVEPEIVLEGRRPSVAKPKASVKVLDHPKKPKIEVTSGRSHTEVVAQTATATLARTSMDDFTRVEESSNSARRLLSQLTGMHDNLQKAQTARWDEFLGKLNSIVDNGQRELTQIGVELLGVSGSGLTGMRDGPFKFSGAALSREFNSLVLGGVPVAYRAKIWGECSGARTLKTPGVYQALVDIEEETEAMSQIDLDLYRTMPYNVFFGSEGPGVQKLRRVLVAFSRRNPEVGYCQGSKLIWVEKVPC